MQKRGMTSYSLSMSDNEKTDSLVGLAQTIEQAEFLRRSIRAQWPRITIYVTFSPLVTDYFEVSVGSHNGGSLPKSFVQEIARFTEGVNNDWEKPRESELPLEGPPVGVDVPAPILTLAPEIDTDLWDESSQGDDVSRT